MRIVVVGGTGLVGAKLVARLVAGGHDAVAASPSTGVDTITGAGLAEAIAGADAVVDVSNPPVRERALEFFTRSTRNQLAAERTARVRHHVVLSIVGAEHVPGNVHLAAKVAQEAWAEVGGVPWTILRATQFFELLSAIVESGAAGDAVRVPTAAIQPVAAADVAATLAELASGAPRGRVELGGPETLGIDAWARRLFAATGDKRTVVRDPDAGYFGGQLIGDAMTTGPGARIAPTDFDAWFAGRAICRPR